MADCIPQSSSVFSVVEQIYKKEQMKETYFVIKPSFSCRMKHLTRFETTTKMINKMLFVTNEFILVQFKNKMVPFTDDDGLVMDVEEDKVAQFV